MFRLCVKRKWLFSVMMAGSALSLFQVGGCSTVDLGSLSSSYTGFLLSQQLLNIIFGLFSGGSGV